MRRKINDSVIVITGASSGIGRATALAFARRGAAVVVAARREEALAELASECERFGGRALAVPTDVADETAVDELARRAIERFDHFDIWVNNAAVTMFARFEEAPSDAFRQVIETNLFGYIYGARAALPYFRRQGGGILINVASVVSKIGEPYTSAYVTSKFAILGLSTSLREEIRDPNIYICSVLPASVDTPIYQQGANFTGRAIKPLEPIYDAEYVAHAIVRCAESPRREVIVGNSSRAAILANRIWPSLVERIMASRGQMDRFTSKPCPPTMGNLFQPMPQWAQVSGGWKARVRTPERRWALVGLATAIAALLGALSYTLTATRVSRRF